MGIRLPMHALGLLAALLAGCAALTSTLVGQFAGAAGTLPSSKRGGIGSKPAGI